MKLFSLMRVFEGIFVAFALIVNDATFAQPARFNRECAKIQEINAQINKLVEQVASMAIGNKASWCPLRKQQIARNIEMIGIFDRDPERCGVAAPIVDTLKTSNQKLEDAIEQSCSDTNAD